MLESLADRTYRHLFLAQVVALLGTGMATVALGIIFTIKMVAYVGIAPISGAFADRVNRRAMLVGLDVVRAGAALAGSHGRQASDGCRCRADGADAAGLGGGHRCADCTEALAQRRPVCCR